MKERPGHAVKKQIRTAAIRLFSSRGIENTSVRDIVRAARTTQPMLYYYFNSKEDLYLDVFESISKEILKGIGAILAAGNGPQDTLTNLFSFHHRYYRTHPAAAAFLLRSTLTKSRNSRLRLAVSTSRRAYRELMRRTVEDWSAKNIFPVNKLHAAAAILDAVPIYFMFMDRKGEGRHAPDSLPGELSAAIFAGIS